MTGDSTHRERLPDPIRRFLKGAVSSVEDLEIVLLLRRNPERYWDAESVSDRLEISPQLAAASLETLARHNLLDVRLSDVIRYRYNPMTGDELALVNALADAWRHDRALVMKELTANSRSLSDFSNAFRLGKNERRRG
jgi:hypothetical protein